VFDEIQQLKKKKNAVILAHYYAPDDVQYIADDVGDSYFLSKKATEYEADIIVFCGVLFMGESAKILNPDKKVLMPDLKADCPMAHMVTPEDIRKIRSEYEDIAVVCYINSTAEAKMYSDVCITSSNAVKIVKKIPEKNIYFIPDRNLGRYVAEQVPEKNVILHDGYCPTHDDLRADRIQKIKKAHPNALFFAHPECRSEVLREADYIGSTSGIVHFARESQSREFVIGTEKGILCALKKNDPDKRYYLVDDNQICSDMKRITPGKVLDVLKHERNEVLISEETRRKALNPLVRMLELGD